MMDRRELLRRLAVAGLALPAAAAIEAVRVPELVGRPAPAIPLLALTTPGSRLREVLVVTDIGASRWLAAPSEELIVDRGIVVMVARV